MSFFAALYFYTSAQSIISPNRNTSFVWRPDDVTNLAMTYTDWNSGEPNCASGQERCVVLNDSMSYQWHTVGCGFEAFAICEMHL